MKLKTPYLKKFNTDGGTLYVFPSVSLDLTKTFASSDYDFKFSHFACLNIPDVCNGVYTDGDEKGLYITSLMGQWGEDELDATSANNSISENFQNYIMNFETAILNGEGDNDDYDPDILTTVSEKIFWNWLQKVGAIKFNESHTAELYDELYDRTVQYIGNIDVMNVAEVNGDVFEEIYIHIPSSVGASTSVIFRTGEMTDTKNYLNKNYPLGQNTGEYIIGSEDRPEGNVGDNTKYGLTRKMFTDIDTAANVYKGDIGHTIDFRDSSYDGGEGINNMNAKSVEDFEFNTVLIYYDIYEKTETSNVKRVATNLYGVLFLDNVKEINNRIFIQRYPKKKETVYGNGNSYALKLDLKIDTLGDADYTNNEVSGSESTTSMNLYMRSMEKLQNCIDIFYTLRTEIVKLSGRVDALENAVMGIDSVNAIKEDINRLYDLCDGNAIIDTSTILGLIDKNTKRLDTIMNGGKDLKLQFDTDVLQPGSGIGLEKSQNKVVINAEQKYSINTVYNGLSTNDEEITEDNPIDSTAELKVCRIPLKPGENFAVIHINDIGDSTTDVRINIDEETNNYEWELGQSLKLLFVSEEGALNFDEGFKSTKGVIIIPTSGVTIPILGSEFEGHNLIEVICVSVSNNGEKKFIYLIK